MVLADQRPLAERPGPQNKLSKVDVQAILDIAKAPEYAGLSPSKIVSKLAAKRLCHSNYSSF